MCIWAGFKEFCSPACEAYLVYGMDVSLWSLVGSIVNIFSPKDLRFSLYLLWTLVESFFTFGQLKVGRTLCYNRSSYWCRKYPCRIFSLNCLTKYKVLYCWTCFSFSNTIFKICLSLVTI